jgi:hypothetical protein
MISDSGLVSALRKPSEKESSVNTEQYFSEQPVAPVAKVGAGLFALWGILHSWVGYEGLKLYFAEGLKKQWEFFVGGKNAPLSGFAFPTDPETMHVHANFLLNFCLDVAGYGLLGLVVAYLVYRRASWFAYFLGVAMIGICDMSFTFLQLTSGIISLNIASVSGPVIWFLAAITTPFGMPSLREAFSQQRRSN